MASLSSASSPPSRSPAGQLLCCCSSSSSSLSAPLPLPHPSSPLLFSRRLLPASQTSLLTGCRGRRRRTAAPVAAAAFLLFDGGGGPVRFALDTQTIIVSASVLAAVSLSLLLGLKVILRGLACSLPHHPLTIWFLLVEIYLFLYVIRVRVVIRGEIDEGWWC